jgi:Asp/Glu/hydantoin racemase
LRILLLNPNTSQDMTERMLAVARAVASVGTTIVPVTAARGVPYIASRAEAQIGGAIALEMIAEYHRDVDAVVIAAFGDPGLLGARELFDIPVVGMAEAAMLSACMLGRRFGIVTFARALGAWYEDCVAMHGLSGRCAGIRMLDAPIRAVATVQDDSEDLLVALAGRSVEADEADVIILAGAPLAGLARRVAHRIPVPVIDQVAAAVKQAEALVALRPRKATTGTFSRPPAKPAIGLPQPLADRIAHADEPASLRVV